MKRTSQSAIRLLGRTLEVSLGSIVAAVFGWLVIRSLADGIGLGLIVFILLLMD